MKIRARVGRLFVAFLFIGIVHGASLFSVEKILNRDKPVRVGYGVYDPSKVFVPSLEAQVSVRRELGGKGLFAKAYFFNELHQIVASVDAPALAYVDTTDAFGMPDVFFKGKSQALFFPVPPELRVKRWSAVVVFGNAEEAAARAFPSGGSLTQYDYPERKLVQGIAGRMSVPAPQSAASGVIEYVAKTRSLQQPQITLFFKLPKGVTGMSDLKGILGRVVIAADVNTVRERFFRDGTDPQPGSVDELAQKYKLGLLTWGARTIWTKTANGEALSPQQQRADDVEFDLVADGWERGVEDMVRQYGIPGCKMLLSGQSQAGQWVHRLALRRADRVLAVHTHISSSYDLPTASGARTTWLVTTGEQESGAEQALDFYDGCRKQGYPMVIKVEPGLGHDGSDLANRLEYEFFKSVLDHPSPLGAPTAPALLQGFQRPEFYGDVSDQRVVPAARVNDIEPENRVPLPTREIAGAWAGRPVAEAGR